MEPPGAIPDEKALHPANRLEVESFGNRGDARE